MPPRRVALGVEGKGHGVRRPPDYHSGTAEGVPIHRRPLRGRFAPRKFPWTSGRFGALQWDFGQQRTLAGAARLAPSAKCAQGRPVNWEDAIIDAAATDTGMRRSNNQDSHTAVRASGAETWKRRGHLFMVADGMGAHAVGELASKLAVDNIPHNYFKAKDGTAAEAVTLAYQQVGALIHGKAAANRDFQGMGTTCSTLLLLPQGVLIAPRRRLPRVSRPRRPDRPAFLRPQPGLGADPAQPPRPRPRPERSVPRNVITRSLGPDPTSRGRHRGPPPRRARRRLSCSAPTASRARSPTPSWGRSPPTSTPRSPAAT